jgi:translation initiation factor IF-2
MRARGASVTDIVVLVVAADDGVKPQTIEAISHAKAAKVPIITCINKMDKPEANPDRVKQMLTEHELIVEDFGGDSPCVQVSAKMQQGLDDLLEMILLVSELNDYQANPSRMAKGTVIEAKLDRGRGPVATVIVQDGTLSVGQYFITGQTYGKIRAMHDHLGNNVEEAPPAMPVEILGINDVPSAGDLFQVVEDEANARKISAFRKEKAREDTLRRHQHTSLDQLFSSLSKAEVKDLCIIIKADVHGSIEGLVYALNKIESEKVNLRIVLQGVGTITENDVLLAVASDAIIIGFNTKTERKAEQLAEHEGIDIRHYSVIYEVVNQIESAMLGLVAPTMEEREIGKAIVKQVFSVAKLGKVAGCSVESGMVKREALVRVVRNSEDVFKGHLQTL